MRRWDWTDRAMAVLGVVIVSALGAALTDAIADYRAEPAQIACRVAQQEPMRRSFSSQVTCVPALNRRDTLTVVR